MIVLDTHVWVWYIDSPDVLSSSALHIIDKSLKKNSINISSISSWEIYMLEKKGRLKFKIPVDLWIQKCERLSYFRFIPVDNDIAKLAVSLPGTFHSDPADRIIIATANSLAATLLTKDPRILNYPHVKTIW